MASCLRHLMYATRNKCINVNRYIVRDKYLTSFVRYYGSALFISGKHASKTFVFVTPYLDLENKLFDIDKVQKDLTLRGVNVNAAQMKETWEMYKKIHADKSALDNKGIELSNRMKELYSKQEKSSEDEQEITRLKTQSNIVKQEIKSIKNVIWDFEETFIPNVLKLPNELDQRTPPKDSVVLKQFGSLHSISEKERKCHIEIGKSLGLLEYKNPIHCYLCNEAALFELGALGYAGKILGDANMIRVAGSDFSRSSVVEGCGLDHENPAEVFLLEDHNEVEEGSSNHMHLVGGASLVSFLAMHTRQLINPKYLPLRYFATGRQYTPFYEDSPQIGLFTVCQASTAHVFSIIKDMKSEQYNAQFEDLVQTVSKMYDNICDHYRIVMRAAPELRPWESMRVSFEMWSQFSEQYIEVGHLSLCGDYFSKRLLMAYQTSDGRDFPAVISGTVLSVPRLLGCLLEQNVNKFVIPEKIVQHMPIDNYGLINNLNTKTETTNSS